MPTATRPTRTTAETDPATALPDGDDDDGWRSAASVEGEDEARATGVDVRGARTTGMM